LAERLASDHNPELLVMKARYRDEFREAFGEAVARLAPRDRNLLRYQLLDGLTTHQIGTIYRVHRVTITRWLKKARDNLLEETRSLLIARLRVEPQEFNSIMGLIQSQLDLSLSRVLARSEVPDADIEGDLEAESASGGQDESTDPPARD
jgi:RNA polymerase sigma-70 factor (ECF subfamily)